MALPSRPPVSAACRRRPSSRVASSRGPASPSLLPAGMSAPATQGSLRLFQARLGNAQAMRPIRRRGLLAQLLAGQQVLRGGFQVAPFNVKLTEAAIQVCRSEGHGLALARREAQCLLIAAFRLMEAA